MNTPITDFFSKEYLTFRLLQMTIEEAAAYHNRQDFVNSIKPLVSSVNGIDLTNGWPCLITLPEQIPLFDKVYLVTEDLSTKSFAATYMSIFTLEDPEIVSLSDLGGPALVDIPLINGVIRTKNNLIDLGMMNVGMSDKFCPKYTRIFTNLEVAEQYRAAVIQYELNKENKND